MTISDGRNQHPLRSEVLLDLIRCRAGSWRVFLALSVKLNGHDPYCYLRNVLERLPIQPTKCLGTLLPHYWHV